MSCCCRVGRATFNLSICMEDIHKIETTCPSLYTSPMETLMVSCLSVFYGGEGNCSQS